MRYGKVELQLGAKQKYCISRCEEKESIQLTITMPVRNDKSSWDERKELIDNITSLVSCPKCFTLHVTLDAVRRENAIFVQHLVMLNFPQLLW